MSQIQSLPRRIACSEYCLVKDDKEDYIWVSIYSPNYQGTHWMSRMIIHGCGADSFQALSYSLYMACIQLMKLSKQNDLLFFSDKAESKISIFSLMSTDSRSMIESDEPSNSLTNSSVVAELSDLQFFMSAAEPKDFKVVLFEPVFEDDFWFCSADFTGLGICKTYTSSDSIRVIAKTFRGIHRQFLNWNSAGNTVKSEDGVFTEKYIECLFNSTKKLESIFSDS